MKMTITDEDTGTGTTINNGSLSDREDDLSAASSIITPAPPKEKIHTPFIVTFMSGGLSGTVGAVVTNPLEVIKTRMQSSQYQLATRAVKVHGIWPHIKGTLEVGSNLYRKEGIRALWKGMLPTVVGVMPSRAIYFSTYAQSKIFLNSVLKGDSKDSSLVHLGSAINAGVVTSTITNPIWLVKTKMQLQGPSSGFAPLYTSNLDCLRKVFRTEGISGIYRGLSASYLGAIEGTIQWVLYEDMKKRLCKVRGEKGLSWMDLFGTAASAKLIAAIISYPHEVLRTRMREDNATKQNILRLSKELFKKEGIAGFYGGMTAHLMRVVPNAAIMFFCYECLIHGYHRL